MLGFLLARAGLDVVVLEKHKDFLRDFRGDTIHPSTLELMHELGLLTEFLKLPHARAETFSGRYGSLPVTIADFRHLPTQCKFIALMPQWDFLNFLAEQGRRYKGFRLLMQTEANGLIEEGGRVAGFARKRRADRSKSAPRSSSAVTAAIPTCAKRQALPSRRSARRWTCCGSGFRASPPTASRPAACSCPAASSSRSTAATTGSAPM